MHIFTPVLAIPQKQQAQVEIQGLGTKIPVDISFSRGYNVITFGEEKIK
jgi:hypothetical protein